VSRAVDHVVPLPGGEWQVWRIVALRAPGFPAAPILELAGGDGDRTTPAGYARARTNARLALRQQIADPRVREAILWQSGGALGAIEALVAGDPAEPAVEDARVRKRELHAVSYLQRYRVKNDCIGFFGPIAFGRVDPDQPRSHARAGDQLLARRQVYFEEWGIQALGEWLFREPGMRRYLAPRLAPFMGIDGGMLHVPFSAPRALAPAEAAVLAAVDGVRSAAELARRVRGGAPGLGSEEEVLAVLDRLIQQGVLRAELDLRPSMRPEVELARALDRIEEPVLHAAAQARLSAFDAARDEVARAVGDLGRLDAALSRLDTDFTELTGRGASRAGGRFYAGRKLVFEDCRRDLDLTIGRDVLDRLGPPLSLLLRSARWYSYEAARGYRASLVKLFDQLAQGRGATSLPLVEFSMAAQSLVFPPRGRPPEHIAALTQTLRTRWQELLGVAQDDQRREVAWSVDDLRTRVADAFPAPAPGWSIAIYYSPDVMVCPPPDGATGEPLLVLSELHPFVNTLEAAACVEQYPDRAELVRAWEADYPHPRVLPLVPKAGRDGQALAFPHRVVPALSSPRDVRLELLPVAAVGPRAMAAGSLVVERAGDSLVARSRDGRFTADIIELYGVPLYLVCVDAFRDLLLPGAHAPRVRIGDLVVRRESWRFAPGALGFARQHDPYERFRQCQTWRRKHGLPRWLFAKFPAEEKPIYLDLDSPILVDLMSKHVRCAELEGPLIAFSEMLPDFSQLWLRDGDGDGDGDGYTSELRLVVVDPVSPAGPPVSWSEPR
jgi:Lantibiotic dehydratase, N terminus